MRIAIHADPVFHRIPGGVGAYVKGLVSSLLTEQTDDDYVLNLARSAGPIPRSWDRAKVRRSLLPLRPLYACWNYLRLPSAGNADVVHATNLVIPPVRGAGLVATIHDLGVEMFPELIPPAWRAIYRRGLRRVIAEARVICAVSLATAADIRGVLGVEDARIVIAPPGPSVTSGDRRDGARISALGVRPPFILNVGTLEPRKNQVTLVRAFAKVAAEIPQHQLVIAGSPGWGAEPVMRAIEESPVGDRILITGSVSSEVLATLYASASAFAYPSRYEGFGMPLLEALGFDLPSVAGDTSALREVGGDGALFVSPDDPDALAGALARLVTDESLRSHLKSAGAAAASRFSWSITAEASRRAYSRAAT